jgi:hypothetical protein
MPAEADLKGVAQGKTRMQATILTGGLCAAMRWATHGSSRI